MAARTGSAAPSRSGRRTGQGSCGARAASERGAPGVGPSVAVTAFAGLADASPKKKELSPLPGAEPEQTGVEKLKVILFPTWTADDGFTEPIPPLVLTKSWARLPFPSQSK